MEFECIAKKKNSRMTRSNRMREYKQDLKDNLYQAPPTTFRNRLVITPPRQLDTVERSQTKTVSTDSSNVSEMLEEDEDLEDRKQREMAPFLRNLRMMLENERPDILSWSADGLSFEIHDMNAMTKEVLQKYFKHTKYTSFQRQLNYFNFKKWTKSRSNVCTFSNDNFRKDRPDLTTLITRKKSISNKIKQEMKAAATAASLASTCCDTHLLSSEPKISNKRIFESSQQPIIRKKKKQLAKTEMCLDDGQPISKSLPRPEAHLMELDPLITRNRPKMNIFNPSTLSIDPNMYNFPSSSTNSLHKSLHHSARFQIPFHCDSPQATLSEQQRLANDCHASPYSSASRRSSFPHPIIPSWDVVSRKSVDMPVLDDVCDETGYRDLSDSIDLFEWTDLPIYYHDDVDVIEEADLTCW